jgi:hypothetical protein
LSKFIGKGRKAEAWTFLATVFALDRVCHWFLLVEGL